MYTEDDLLPLSALQHLVFCERQCALIYVEQVWRDNPLTLGGSHLHARVDEEAPRREMRGDLMITRGLALHSLRLGLICKADVVEFHRVTAQQEGTSRDSRMAAAVPLPRAAGLWRPFPVEYKSGKPKLDHCDEVQLCAQALCLEEMLEVEVPDGALYYGLVQHRHQVRFTPALRSLTEAASERLHEIFTAGVSPRVQREPKCDRCSLVDVCQPAATAPGRSASRYLERALRSIRDDEEPT